MEANIVSHANTVFAHAYILQLYTLQHFALANVLNIFSQSSYIFYNRTSLFFVHIYFKRKTHTNKHHYAQK